MPRIKDSDKPHFQKYFNIIATHLLTQGKQSRGTNDEGFDRCLYRSDDGKRCAIGCLIKDDFYSKEFEGLCTTSEGIVQALSLSGVPQCVLEGNMLGDLQSLHDTVKPKHWKKELEDLGRFYGLDSKVFREFNVGV